MTLIGLAVPFVAATCVFPVTSHQIVQGVVATALGQLASTAEETIKEIIPSEGSEGGSESGSEGGSRIEGRGELGSGSVKALQAPATSQLGSSGAAPQAVPPEPQPSPLESGTATVEEAADAEGSRGPASPPTAADDLAVKAAAEEAAGEHQGDQQAPVGQQPPSTPAPRGSPALPSPPTTPRQWLPRQQRWQLGQQPSLIALPPDRAILAGSSRAAVTRAARQLRSPVGPELLEGSEQLLGVVYSRLVQRSWQASGAAGALRCSWLLVRLRPTVRCSV